MKVMRPIFMIMFIVLCVSCDPAVQYTLTFELNNGEPDVVISSGTMVFPENPSRIGYEFVAWLDEEGNRVDASKLAGARLVSDYTFSAEYEVLETTFFVSSSTGGGSSSGESPISAAIKEGAKVIYIDSGNYTEDITIPADSDISIIGAGPSAVVTGEDGLPSAAAADGVTAISGEIKIGDNSTVLLDNLRISSDKEGSSVISATSTTDLTIRNSVLLPDEKGRAIYVCVDASVPATGKSYASIENTYVEIAGSIGTNKMNGIFFDGDSSSEKTPSEMPELDLNLSDVRIFVEGENVSNVYPLGVSRFGKLDAEIGNIAIGIPGNHYAIWISEVGSAERKSYVSITDSHLEGYSAFYCGYTENIEAEISDSTLIGNNYNDGQGNGFSTVSIHQSKTSSYTVRNSHLEFNELGTATQYLAELNWMMDETYDNNSLSFMNCDVTFNNEPSGSEQRVFYCVENTFNGETQLSNNAITFDETTLASILGDRFAFIDTEKVEVDTGIWGTDTVIIAKSI